MDEDELVYRFSFSDYLKERPRNNRCDHCKIEFKRGATLRRHQKYSCPARKVKPAVTLATTCDVCCKIFSRKDHMHRHRRLHFENSSTEFPKGIQGDDGDHADLNSSTEAIKSSSDNPDAEVAFQISITNPETPIKKSKAKPVKKEDLTCDLCDKQFTRKDHRNRHRKLHFRAPDRIKKGHKVKPITVKVLNEGDSTDCEYYNNYCNNDDDDNDDDNDGPDTSVLEALDAEVDKTKERSEKKDALLKEIRKSVDQLKELDFHTSLILADSQLGELMFSDSVHCKSILMKKSVTDKVIEHSNVELNKENDSTNKFMDGIKMAVMGFYKRMTGDRNNFIDNDDYDDFHDDGFANDSDGSLPGNAVFGDMKPKKRSLVKSPPKIPSNPQKIIHHPSEFQFRIIRRATMQGRDIMVDNFGYQYAYKSLKRRNGWYCNQRQNSLYYCRAYVKPTKEGTFYLGVNQHRCIPRPSVEPQIIENLTYTITPCGYKTGADLLSDSRNYHYYLVSSKIENVRMWRCIRYKRSRSRCFGRVYEENGIYTLAPNRHKCVPMPYVKPTFNPQPQPTSPQAPLESSEPITFTLLPNVSRKGTDHLTDSLGYQYFTRSKSKSTILWGCRFKLCKRYLCHATVSQKGNVFTPGINKHRCDPSGSKGYSQRSVPFSEATVICQMCNKAFRSKSALMVHYEKHLAEPPSICEFCGKTFKQKDQLVDHISACHSPQQFAQHENLLAAQQSSANVVEHTFVGPNGPVVRGLNSGGLEMGEDLTAIQNRWGLTQPHDRPHDRPQHTYGESPVQIAYWQGHMG